MERVVVFYYPPVTPDVHFPTWEPLQVVFLARVLEREGFKVKLLDGRLVINKEERGAFIQKHSPFALCISSLTCYQYLDALSMVEFLRKKRIDIPVIFGGWHPSIFPRDVLFEAKADAVVVGQGEMTLLNVLERFWENRSLEGLKGVVWRKGKEVVFEGPAPLVHPDDFPELIPEDFKRLGLLPPVYQISEVLFYMGSVGCPYSCNYCCVGAVCGRKWLPLSPRRVVKEIGSLKEEFGFKKVIFWDNVFFTQRERIEEICYGLGKLGVKWAAHARVNEVVTWPDSFLKTLKEGGCEELFIGAESGSQRILDILNKRVRASDIVPAVRKLKKFEINVTTNWMFGIPGESYSDVLKSVKVIKECLDIFGEEGFKVFMYRFVPLPGTKIYESLDASEKEKLPKSSKEWAEFIWKKVSDGMEPWKGENTSSLFAPSTFYLWKGFFDNSSGPLLKMISRVRLKTGFLKFPIEWKLWKKLVRN